MTPSRQVSHERQAPGTAQPLPEATWLALVAIAYWVAVRVGLVFAVQPEGVASVWPASGLALAVLLLSERRKWGRLLLVIFVTNTVGNLTGGNSLPVSLGFALANTVEAAAGAWVIVHFCGPKIKLTRVVEVVALCGVATLSNGITALLGAAVPALAFGAPFLDVWQVWWVSDGLGIMLVTPVIVTWATSPNVLQAVPPRRLVEGATLIAAMSALAWLMYGPFTIAEESLLRNYMVFPLLIWAALRFRPRGMVTALLVFAAIAVWNTVHGYGIFGFASQSLKEHVLSIQIFLSVATLSGLTLAAAVTERKRAGETLRTSEARYRELADSISDVFFAMDESLTYTYWNKASEALTGISAEAAIGKSLYDLFPDTRGSQVESFYLEAVRTQQPLSFSNAYQLEGKDYVFEISVYPSREGMSVFTKDITERKRAEDALRESEARYRELFENINSGVAVYEVKDDGQDFIFKDFNRAGEKIDNDQRERLIGKSIFEVRPGVEQFGLIEVFRKVWQTGEAAYHPVTLYQDNRLSGWYENFVYKLPSGEIVAVFEDTTERKQAEEQLKTALAEKEALLRELYHRTKNNMQVIYAMLELQADDAKDDYVSSVFRDMGNRIRSMALVHQMLYQSQSLSSIDLREYISGLAALLMRSYKAHPDRISLVLETDSVSVLIDTAIPCGLILNELISNALKHAFPGDRKGEIRIELRQTEDGTIVLQVSDNGIGVPSEFDFRDTDSLGLQTVFALGEHQLEGEVTFGCDRGVTCQIRFQDTLYYARV